MKSDTKKLVGLLGQFETPAALYDACKKVKAQGYKKWEAHSPFPIHGLEDAMGLKPSLLPWIVAATAAVCGIGGFLLWSWMNGVDYKYIIAGKPFFSWPAYFLPGFECAVLSAALACLMGMMALSRLPQLYHPLFTVPRFRRASDDGFFIYLESQDSLFQKEDATTLLNELGATAIDPVEE